LVLIRFATRRPLDVIDLVAAFFLGAMFSTAADAWGLTVTFSVWFMSAIALSAGRARGAFGGRPPDCQRGLGRGSIPPMARGATGRRS
jgi:hypothetical protein